MAIVKFSSDGDGSGNLERRVGIKAAKKAAKQPAKKHALKHPGKKSAKHVEKHAAKHAPDPLLHGIEPLSTHGKAGDDLAKAFHHLQRSAAVISLLGPESGGDLRTLLDFGVEQYRTAAAPKAKKHTAKAAQGLLRAAEHLSLAALYSARLTHLAEVPAPAATNHAKEMKKLRSRLEDIDAHPDLPAGQIHAMASELLRRAQAASHDIHLEHELIKAVDALCSALEHEL